MLASARGAKREGEKERVREGGKKRGRGRSEGGDQVCSKYRRTTFIFCALIIHLAPALVRLFLPRSQIKAEMDAPRRNRDPTPPPLVKCRGRPLAGYCTVKIVQRFPLSPPSFSRIISVFFETFIGRGRKCFLEIPSLLVFIEEDRKGKKLKR